MTGAKPSLWRGLAALAPLAGFAALFFLRPNWLFAIVGGALALGVLLLVAILGLFAFQRLAPARAERLGFKAAAPSATAFVGREGLGVRLRIVDEPRVPFRVEWARNNYAILFAALTLFGPGLTTAFLLRPPDAGVPAPVLIGAGLLSLIASVFLAAGLNEYVFHRPSLTVAPDALILWKGRTEARRFGPRDIDNLGIELRPYVFTDEGSRVERDNFVLVAHLRDGGEAPLCISERKDQIEAIASRIRLSLGLR